MKWLVRHAMCALYPRTDELPGLADVRIDTYLDQLSRDGSPAIRAGIVAGALVIEATPVITTGVPLPAFLLPKPLLHRHVDRLSGTSVYPLRLAVLIVKMFAGFCWGASPEIRRAMGLDPYPDDPATWQAGDPQLRHEPDQPADVGRRSPCGVNT